MSVNPERMRQARLAANMSRADLAHALRHATNSRVKATERGIRGWEKGEYKPSDGVIPAYAEVTGKPLEFFYGGDDEAEAALAGRREAELLEALRPLARLPELLALLSVERAG